MPLLRWITVLTAAAAALAVSSPAEASWENAQQVNGTDPAVTDLGAAYVGTADYGDAVAVWLEWRGSDARVMAAHRPVGGTWGPAQLVDDLTEKPDGTDPQVGLDSMVVLPDGDAVLGYHEYDATADADFRGRVVTLDPDGSVTEELARSEAQWQLVSDNEGDWLASTRQHDHCACQNYTFYSDRGAVPEQLGTYLGFDLHFALSGRERVYYAVDDADGLYQRAHILRVQRVDAATGAERTEELVRPHGRVIGFDLSASQGGDVDLAWSVRHPGSHRPDVVLAAHRPADRSWSKPHALFASGRGNNRPVGAPQVATSGSGNPLVVWSTPVDDAGRVDLDKAAKGRYGPWRPTRRMASDLVPDARPLSFGIRVSDVGHALAVVRHLAPCPRAPDTTCHTVSVKASHLRHLDDPKVLTASPTPYETVTAALSENALAIVLTVESGSTTIQTRTDPGLAGR